MATYNSPGTNPVYNVGVQRLSGFSDEETGYGVIPWIFADLLPNKDIRGGQVAKDFHATAGTPLKETATPGIYEVADDWDTDTIAGLLLLNTDAYDGGRQINIVKGGTIRTDLVAFEGKTASELAALATKLGGVYDERFRTIKF